LIARVTAILRPTTAMSDPERVPAALALEAGVSHMRECALLWAIMAAGDLEWPR
jgi:hypothetical protein